MSTFFYPFYILFVFKKHLQKAPGHSSLPDRVTQTFIPEGSGPLAVLLELSCSFPLTLITAHGGNKRGPKGSPVFWTYLFLSPLYSCNPKSP